MGAALACGKLRDWGLGKKEGGEYYSRLAAHGVCSVLTISGEQLDVPLWLDRQDDDVDEAGRGGGMDACLTVTLQHLVSSYQSIIVNDLGPL